MVEDSPPVEPQCLAPMGRVWLVVAWSLCHWSTDWERWDSWRTRRCRGSRSTRSPAITDCSIKSPCSAGCARTLRRSEEIRRTSRCSDSQRARPASAISWSHHLREDCSIGRLHRA
jgi:hypothetical protein